MPFCLFVFSNVKFEPKKSMYIRPGDMGLEESSSHVDKLDMSEEIS